jgi:hypothetical protein
VELGEVLSKAWKIIWKNKILWIFGILASCGRSAGGGGGGGGNSRTNFNLPNNGNFNFENGNNPFTNGQIPGMEELQRNFDKIFGNGNQPVLGIIIGIICLLFIIALIAIFLGTIGRIGLIRGTVLAEAGQEPLTFGQVWTASTPYFWKVFLLNLLTGLVIGLAILILILPLILLSIATLGVGILCFIPVICLLIPITLILNVILEQANVAIVVENLGLWEAVKRGWTVCKTNIGPVAVVALIVIMGGGILEFIFALPLILVFIPLFMGMISKDQTMLTTGLATAGVLLCCLVPVVVALQGVLQSYIGSVWTLTFLRLTAEKIDPTEHQVVTMTE